jgi:hypothetical protein
MGKTLFNRWAWSFWYRVFHIAGLIFLPFPSSLPLTEAEKLSSAASLSDVLIIFNSGGWGDTPLERADDFTPILEGMRQVITGLGYLSAIVPYTRTLRTLPGRISGAKEQFNSFKNNSRIFENDIRILVETFPEKRFIIAGFSTGGGLTGRVMKGLVDLPNVYGVSVGIPAWFYSYNSEKSLVLNNSGRDPICSGDANDIALAVLKAPARWINSRRNGRRLSLALAVQIPHHEYSWSSPEVGIPITTFLEANLKI